MSGIKKRLISISSSQSARRGGARSARALRLQLSVCLFASLKLLNHIWGLEFNSQCKKCCHQIFLPLPWSCCSEGRRKQRIFRKCAQTGGGIRQHNNTAVRRAYGMQHISTTNQSIMAYYTSPILMSVYRR